MSLTAAALSLSRRSQSAQIALIDSFAWDGLGWKGEPWGKDSKAVLEGDES